MRPAPVASSLRSATIEESINIKRCLVLAVFTETIIHRRLSEHPSVGITVHRAVVGITFLKPEGGEQQKIDLTGP